MPAKVLSSSKEPDSEESKEIESLKEQSSSKDDEMLWLELEPEEFGALSSSIKRLDLSFVLSFF